MKARRFLFVTTVIVITLLVTVGCGGGGTATQTQASSPTPEPITLPGTLTISPPADILGPGGTRTFTANMQVTWTVQESAGGSITGDGKYAAPATPGTYHIVAVSTADQSKTATATIQVVQSGFTTSGTLLKNRVGHTSTLLPDGKVLVAGGSWGTSFWDLVYSLFTVPEAELFDPSTGASSIAGTVSRTFGTATLLSDGKVLIIGGEYGWNGVPGSNSLVIAQTAEVYDPVKGEFQPVGDMSQGREYHAATVLADGRVLVTGGWGQGGVSMSSDEIYDPTSGTFTLTGPMATRRDSHTSTLLRNGKVLITGGNDYQSSAGTATAELYDPVTGTFSPTGNMSEGRAEHTATLLPNGNVLIAGGIGLSTAEVYDPSTGIFTLVGPMAVPRGMHTATLLPDGRVLIAGGYTGADGATYTAEIYDPTTKSFVLTGTLEEARFAHTATRLANGNVVLLGGSSSAELMTSKGHVEIYK